MTDWRPATAIEALTARASLLAYLRDFFAQRHVLEVETPYLARHGVTELHVQCIAVPGYGYLQSSPEYHMKRMLAHGCGPIYQISRVFRDDEAGRRHNPEFSLLEWYRPNFSLPQLITECTDLLTPLLQPSAVKRYRFRDVFKQHTGLDPLTASVAELSQRASQISQMPELDKPALVDWLMASVVEPALPTDQLSVIEDFPSWAAALAQCHQDDDGQWVAQRFEIYAGGFELANGYHELLDATEQAARFTKDRALRQQQGLPDMAPDPWLLAALKHGLPPCSGVAMGLDRLLMAQLGVDDIRTLLTFPIERA